MATGIIGTVSGNNSTLSYTPATNAKVIVAVYSGSGYSQATVNGGVVAYHTNGGSAWNTPFWVGAGQTVTITVTGSPSAMVSAIEE